MSGYCWAVGADATILVSRDGGVSWRAQRAPAGVRRAHVALRAVACYPFGPHGVDVCYAVGDRGTILFSKQSVRTGTWVREGTGPTTGRPFTAVACESATGRCWAVGEGVAAEGPGRTWRLIAIYGPAGSHCGPGGPRNACLSGVAIAGRDEHFADGGGGNIFAQFDYRGPVWHLQISLGAGSFHALACTPARVVGHSHCIAVGTDDTLVRDRIYVTLSSGARWAPARSPAGGSLPALNGVALLRGAPARGLWVGGRQRRPDPAHGQRWDQLDARDLTRRQRPPGGQLPERVQPEAGVRRGGAGRDDPHPRLTVGEPDRAVTIGELAAAAFARHLLLRRSGR